MRPTETRRAQAHVQRGVVLALLASFALSVGIAQAEPQQESDAAHAERRLVSVQIAGDPASVAAVLDVLRERNAGVETTFEIVPSIDRQSVVTPGERNERQLARIWIDLTEPPGQENAHPPLTIYVVDGPWERVLVRPVVRQANAEITWEEIGHIVELAVEALRAGESIGVAREQLLPPPPPPAKTSEPVAVIPPPPPRPTRWKLRGGGFYSVSAYGAPGLQLDSGPGALLELHKRAPKLEYGGTLTAQYSFPSTVDRGSALVHFEGGAFHLLASGSYVFSNRHQLFLGVGGGVELVQAYSSSIDLENVRFVGAELHTIPTGRALARYCFSTSNLRLFAGVGIDVPLRHTRYLLTREDETVVLFEPWKLHPFVMFGIETN